MRAEVQEKRLNANGEKIIGLQTSQRWSEERVLGWPKGSFGFFHKMFPILWKKEAIIAPNISFLVFFVCLFLFFLSRVCYPATKMLLFYVLVFWLRLMCDLSFPTRDQTCSPCIVSQSASHWTAREAPQHFFLEECCILYADHHCLENSLKLGTETLFLGKCI